MLFFFLNHLLKFMLFMFDTITFKQTIDFIAVAFLMIFKQNWSLPRHFKCDIYMLVCCKNHLN